MFFLDTAGQHEKTAKLSSRAARFADTLNNATRSSPLTLTINTFTVRQPVARSVSVSLRDDCAAFETVAFV